MLRNARLRDPRIWIALQCSLAVFFASRYFVLTGLNVQLSDVPQYVEYCRDYAAAAEAGRPLSQFHRDAVSRRLERQELKLPPSAGEWRSQIEYPPLAVAWIVFASSWGPKVTGEAGTGDEVFGRSYRLTMALVDVLTFLVLAAAALALFPDETPARLALRLGLFVTYGLLLGHLIYDRLDLLVGFTILLSLVLLITRAHYAWSFLVLAAGVNLKIVPVVLAPLWVVATLPASSFTVPWQRRHASRLIWQIAGRSLLIVALAGAWLAASVAVVGRPTLDFLRYQAGRGLEMGSVYASGLLVLRELGASAQTVFEFGSYSVKSGASTILANASPAIASICLGVVYFMFLRTALHRSVVGVDDDQTALARVVPFSMIQYSVLLLMVFVSTSKVFSPQFLLWLVPLFPLLGTKGRGAWIMWAAFGLICVMTTVIWPFRFHPDIAGTISITSTGIVASGPTALGVALLMIRNALVGATTILVFVEVARKRVR